MKVDTNVIKKRTPKCWPIDVPAGTVYSWGIKGINYLRVSNGTVCLVDGYTHIGEDHAHFSKEGRAGHNDPWVDIADATLTATYEV